MADSNQDIDLTSLFDFSVMATFITELHDACNLLHDACNLDLKGLVEKKDHNALREYLHDNRARVNSLFDFEFASFTGLEYALYQDDWKMAAIFFINGANPEFNHFDGVIQNMASMYGHGEPDIMNGFDTDDPKPVPGFEGLYLLVNSDDEVAKAYLYMMECLYSGKINIKESCTKLYQCLDTLSGDLQYSSAQLNQFLVTCLATFKHLGLSEEVVTFIVEVAVLDELWDILKEYAERSTGQNQDD